MLQIPTSFRIFRFINVLTLCLLPLAGGAADAQLLPISAPVRASSTQLSPQLVAERVAGRIMQRKDFPADYINDMQLEALLVLADATGEVRYLDFVKEAMIRRGMPPGYRHTWISQLYTSISFDLLMRTGDRRYVGPFLEETLVYRDAVVRAYDGTVSVYLSEIYDNNDEPVVRTASGATYVKREWQPVLLDQLQEYATRMIKAGCLTGDRELIDEGVTQIELMRNALRDPQTGLWSHARGFVDSASTLTNVKWGRGHAWALRGLVEALTYLPAEAPQSERIARMLTEFAETLIRYQDADGFWRQVVDRPDSYQETSATGLISHYLARAVQQGLLPEQPYRQAAHAAFVAVAANRVAEDGSVHGGSKSTPPLPSITDYLEWETPVDDGHAVAAVIFAAAGQIAFDKASATTGSPSNHAAMCKQLR
jgi:rhamnogalacturonyl hydrolase YesR